MAASSGSCVKRWWPREQSEELSPLTRGREGCVAKGARDPKPCETLRPFVSIIALKDHKINASKCAAEADRIEFPHRAKMSASLLAIFEGYQKARVQFVQAVAEAATRPQNVDVMQNAGVMQLLKPLLLDNVRRAPATALGA